MAALPEPNTPGEIEEVEPDEAEDARTPPSRSRDLLGRHDSPCRKHLVEKIFPEIRRGFEAQADRSDNIDKCWKAYECQLDDNQFYNGTAQIYVPIIHDAVQARATRFANQLFPSSGRNIDCTPSDGAQPYEVMALENHYIKRAKLKTQIVKPLLRMGDIEGQYNLYRYWGEVDRQIVSRETMTMAGDFEVETIVEEEIAEGRPRYEILHDSDVLILPANAEDVEDALAIGGMVVIVRRLSKTSIAEMADLGEIVDDDSLILDRSGNQLTGPGLDEIAKKLIQNVGIRAKSPHAMLFECWTMLPLNDAGSYSKKGTRRLCRAWFDVLGKPLGAKRNPYWNDKCPLISAPVEKIAGSVKGASLVEPLLPLQYEANDAANEAADADHFGAMPIIARAPSEGNVPLILNLAAVWDIAPNDIKFMQFPDLTQRAISRIQRATQAIMGSLGVNPSMLPQQQVTGKSNQARIAQEQQIDLLTTTEAVSVVTEDVLTPSIEWDIDLDHQFRDREMTVRTFGEMGLPVRMVSVKPLQNGNRYSWSWVGTEQAKLNLAMQQQGTAFINILRGMRQDLQAEGYTLRLGPMLERQAVDIFGPLTGSLILLDQRHSQTVDPQTENWLLGEGYDVPIHPSDNDVEHIQAHMQFVQQSGDPHGNGRIHLQKHVQAQSMKAAAAAQQQMRQQGAPGVPGGAGPGVAGTPPQGVPRGINRGGMPPRQGAQPAGPRLIKQQPGAMPQDQMPRAGVVLPPRKVM